MVELVGWIAATAFAICALPQAIHSFKEGHSNDMTHGFLWLWFIGEVFTIPYVFIKHGWTDVPLLTNYFFNFGLLSVIMKYKYFPRNK
jgi:uncharacterized protein with PQ loop repeat